jgi:Immune inhibitor A-like metallopeptidase, VEG domain
MTNEIKRLLIGLIIAILLVALIPTFSSASELSSNTSGESGFIPKEDNLPDPLTDKQLKLKKKALEANLNGKAYGKTYQVSRGQYVELEREVEGAIWTVLGEFADLKHNQTKVHPGAGLLLPIDAHPKALKKVNGMVWQNHIQTYDSTFTLDRTDAVNNLHVNSLLSPIPSLPAAKVFDDRILYWDAANPQESVKNPNTGTIIEIRSINALGGFMEVQVHPAK